MEAKIFLYALGIWVLFVIIAILNGTFRNSFLVARMGEYAAHVVSTIILVCVILAVTYLFLSYIRLDYTKTDLLLIGGLWLTLTVSFEFLFGHYIVGHSWSTLLADYNIFKGRLWLLVLIAAFIAPLLFGLILRR